MKRRTGLFIILSSLLFCVLGGQASAEETENLKGESIYYITVDRFMNGDSSNDGNLETDSPDGYHGGDIQGIIERLEHVKDLGFTTIWLSPLMQSSDFEGYQVEEYRSVDEHFGTMEEVRTLVEEAHAIDMKVVMDMPVTSVSAEHPWVESGWTEEPGDGTASVNTEDSEVQEEVSDILSYWSEEAGIDGFGFPDVEEAEQEFWTKVTSDPESGITIGKGEDESYLDGGFDIWYDEGYQKTISEVFASTGEVESLKDPEAEVSASAVDFRDTKRFTTMAEANGFNPITRWKLALTQLYADQDVPVVMYGTSIPMGEKPGIGNLPMMNFGGTDEEVTQRIEKLNSMRSEFPSLIQGEKQELYKEDGMAIYQVDGDQTMIMAINNSEETKTANIASLEDDKQLRGLMHDGLLRQSEDGDYPIVLERETADVFVVEDNAGLNWAFIGFVGGILSLFVIFVVVVTWKNRRNEKTNTD
ncbi:alpha-amylase family glycosyl hydrolase [Salimicrobium sp. PL1-032A]|uniref:alpha-amylase family glycosyl hydrolase n=1 Tax=Salimicrobium sp. PL1-032A TaxID=3095364 RepID=UPI00325FE4F8